MEYRDTQAELMASDRRSRETERYIAERFDALVGNVGMFPTVADDAAWEWQAMAPILRTVKDKRVLDLGCGKGRFARLLQRHGAQVTGVDSSAEMIRIARGMNDGLTYHVGSATALPVPDALFDIVICIEVLEHVPDLPKALREIARVLVPGGSLIIIDKNLYGLHPRRGYPAALEKILQEWRGRWMYPWHAPFRERWFSPWALRRALQKEFHHVAVTYPKRQHSAFVALQHALLPWMSYDVLWHAQK